MKQHFFILLAILFFTSCNQNKISDVTLNDVLKNGYKGHVKSIKTREYIIEYNYNTGKNDTIPKVDGSMLLNKDLYFNKAGYLITEIDYYYKEKIINKYDSNNYLSETIESDLGDMIKERQTYLYDNHGQMIEETHKTPDNKIIRKFICEYSHEGLLIKKDRVIDKKNEVDTYIYRYDNKGRLIHEEHKSNRWANTLKKIEYAPQGNYKILKNYHDGNLEYVKTYNSNEIETHLVWYNKNGVKRYENWYDDYGNILKQIDYEKDGTTPEEIETKNYTYNDSGKILKSVIKNKSGEIVGNDEYLYDKKGRLIYSSVKGDLYGSNNISEYKYDKFGNIVYNRCSDYAERTSYRKFKYDKHQNKVVFYEDNGGPDGESGHEHYSLYKYEIEYYPYEETHIVDVEKSYILDKEKENTGMYVIRGDTIYLYYVGKEYSVFDYKTKSGVFISGLIKNTNIEKNNDLRTIE